MSTMEKLLIGTILEKPSEKQLLKLVEKYIKEAGP